MTAYTCAECGVAFTPKKGWQAFCGSRCQTRHRDLLARRGKVALPFLLAERDSKRKSTPETRYALAQLHALSDMWKREDKACGRDCTAVVRRKMREGWQACDVS